MKKIGSDLDGVLGSKRTVTTKEEARSTRRTQFELPKSNELYIISCRPMELRQDTANWLEYYNINYDELYLCDDNRIFKGHRQEEKNQLQAWFKGCIINKLDLDLYIEDRVGVIEKLRELTNTGIVSPEVIGGRI